MIVGLGACVFERTEDEQVCVVCVEYVGFCIVLLMDWLFTVGCWYFVMSFLYDGFFGWVVVCVMFGLFCGVVVLYVSW